MMWLLAALLVSPAAEGHRLLGSPTALSCCSPLGFAAGGVRLTLEEGTRFWLRLQGKGSQVRKCLFIHGSSSQCGLLRYHCRQEERQHLPLSAGLAWEEALPPRTCRQDFCASMAFPSGTPGFCKNLGGWFAFRAKFSNKWSL